MSRQPARHTPPPMPPMPPELARGTCVTHPRAPDLWCSTEPAEREAAQHLCLTRCPVREPCLAWALSLRTADDLIMTIGGLTPGDRRRIRSGRQRAVAAAAAPAA